MKNNLAIRLSLPGQLASLALASALALPMMAQQPAGTPPPTAPAAAQSTPPAATATPDAREGFWGRVNPFARKKWVNRRVDPLKDRLSELDEMNAKNARDIQDVDGRAQSGIRQAQSAADAANQAALAAADRAQAAGATAQGAAGRVDGLNATVAGLDQYRQATEVEVAFRASQPVLSEAARKQLDDLAASLTGRQGYILEIEAYAPGAGSVGIQRSARLAEAVKRYLVAEREIPVYRLHSVALGNAPGNEPDAKPIKTAKVRIHLMENTLAAK
jgi:hypothetical protein